jgi:hypothetical protein
MPRPHRIDAAAQPQAGVAKQTFDVRESKHLPHHVPSDGVARNHHAPMQMKPQHQET